MRLRGTLSRFALAAALIASLLLGGLPGVAMATTFHSPNTGEDYYTGRRITIVVRASDVDSTGVFPVYVVDEDYQSTQVGDWEIRNGERSWRFEGRVTLDEVGEYELMVGPTFVGLFTVHPALRFNNLGVAPDKFFPIVRDGFRDRTTFSWNQNMSTGGTRITVVNGKGKAVVRDNLGSENTGPHDWTWNGRTRRGKKLPAGRYRIRVSGTHPDTGARFESGRKPVEIATRFVKKRRRLEKNGTQTSSLRKNGNCNRGSLQGSLLLTCLGGQYTATYSWRVPASTVKVRRSFRKEAGAARCRSRTGIDRRGRRVRTSFTVVSPPFRFSQCWIHEARLTFVYKVRI
ncbi:MAG: FlgD immunoglobulin-like domain containing protein [Actinomycetota bacterium]